MKDYSLDKITIKEYCDIWKKIELYKERILPKYNQELISKCKFIDDSEKNKLTEIYERRLNNELNLFAISILNNVDLQQVRDASINDFSILYNKVKPFFEHTYEPVDSFEFKGVTYFIDYDIYSYGGAMYLDLEGFENSNPSIYESMIYTLSLLIYTESNKFITPEGQIDVHYIGSERASRAEMFQQVPASIFLGIYKRFNEKKKNSERLLQEYIALAEKIRTSLENLSLSSLNS